MEQTKKPALYHLAKVLDETKTQYAIIGGVALQIHQQEPRTTHDVDVAVIDLGLLPRTALAGRGFTSSGSYAHSENWVGPDSTPIQFTDDPAIHGAILQAQAVSLEDTHLKVIRPLDLLHEKLRAARDPARRRSKRLQDLADAQSLVEQNPQFEASLSSAERALMTKGF